MKNIIQKKQYFYSNKFYNKRMNIKNNSPSLSHKENNFFYNTK